VSRITPSSANGCNRSTTPSAPGQRGCRTFGVHRSTYYRWKRLVDRHGLEVLRPREAAQAQDAQISATTSTASTTAR
jgi:transposase-like protein